MTNVIWNSLDVYFSEDRRDYFAHGVNQEKIDIAENFLNLTFSSGYKKFIRDYGGAMINGELIYGLEKQDDMDDFSWSVIDKTLFYKITQQWPGIEDWYIISDDGRGNPIGCKPDGSVWLSDHDAGCEQIKLADNFEEFLEKILNDTLYA